MIDARNATAAYSVEYTHTKFTTSDNSTYAYHGHLHVLPNGFRHDRTLVSGSSDLADTQGTINKHLGKTEVAIADETHLVRMGLYGRSGRSYEVMLGASRDTRLPFDPRSFGLAFVGDMRQGWRLERTVLNILEWRAPNKKRWIEKGIAEYTLGNCVFRIDIDRGYWPVGYKLVNKSSVVQSSAFVQLEKVHGQFRPVLVELTTKTGLEVFDLQWAKEKPDASLLDAKAVAKAKGIVIR